MCWEEIILNDCEEEEEKEQETSKEEDIHQGTNSIERRNESNYIL